MQLIAASTAPARKTRNPSSMPDERKRQQRSADPISCQSYALEADVSTTLLIAMVEGPETEGLQVKIFDPVGHLVAESVPTTGASVATAVPTHPGAYTVEVANLGDERIDFQLTTIRRRPS